ncbi:MAG: succinate dehydrogenase assembly factor 4 [Pseudomonadota bacterium]
MANLTPKQDETTPAATQKPGTESPAALSEKSPPPQRTDLPAEVGGPKGLEPTRYGDWERNGRCTDF